MVETLRGFNVPWTCSDDRSEKGLRDFGFEDELSGDGISCGIQRTPGRRPNNLRFLAIGEGVGRAGVSLSHCVGGPQTRRNETDTISSEARLFIALDDGLTRLRGESAALLVSNKLRPGNVG